MVRTWNPAWGAIWNLHRADHGTLHGAEPGTCMDPTQSPKWTMVDPMQGTQCRVQGGPHAGSQVDPPPCTFPGVPPAGSQANPMTGSQVDPNAGFRNLTFPNRSIWSSANLGVPLHPLRVHMETEGRPNGGMGARPTEKGPYSSIGPYWLQSPSELCW